MGEMIVVTDETDFDLNEQGQPDGLHRYIESGDGDSTKLRSLTRLLVGGALEGWDELFEQVKSWEADVEKNRGQQDGSTTTGSASSPSVTIRYATIGLLFNTQDRWLWRGKRALNIAGRTTGAFISPVADRLDNDSRLQPARNRFEKLVRRGEKVTGNWVDRGQLEENHSRKLVRRAAQEGFNSSMDQLGQAPALQDLIRKQSAGITQDVVDEVRSRTVSADMLAENLARSVFRRSPRSELPPPQTATTEEEVE